MIDYLKIVLGSLLVGVAFSCFFIPHHIAPGGVSGLATVLAHFLPVGVGLLSFLINLPLFALGWRVVGWRFAVRSFVAMTLLSLFIDILPQVDAAGEMMLATLFGSLFGGVGLGLVARSGATTGGTDMAAAVVHRHFTVLSTANFMLLLDAMVVIIAGAVFGVKEGLWALVAVALVATVMDRVLRGFNTAMQFTIITSKPEAISHRILYELDRGCTVVNASGAYSGKEIGMLLCILPKLETPMLRKVVHEEDPDAFVTVANVDQVLGEGFAPLKDE